MDFSSFNCNRQRLLKHDDDDDDNDDDGNSDGDDDDNNPGRISLCNGGSVCS